MKKIEFSKKFKNKKFVAVFSVIAVLVLAGGVYAASEVTSDDNKDVAVKTEQHEKVKDLKSDMKKEQASAKKEEKNVSTSTSNKTESSVKPVKKPSSSGSSSSKPAHSHSWSPVYETQTKYHTKKVFKYCYDGKYYDDYCSAMDAYFADGDNPDVDSGNVYPVILEEQVPYTEEVLVGYKCSCGASK